MGKANVRAQVVGATRDALEKPIDICVNQAFKATKFILGEVSLGV